MMPQRSNLFQEVVGIVHRHMAVSATVEESAMLRNRATDEEREVDVVIRSEVAGHEVTVAVEATATGRPAAVPWVESMLGKHADLPTDKLVLVSEAGFTKQGRRLAETHGAVALSPEDFLEGDPVGVVVNRLRTIWPKLVSLTPQRARVWVHPRDGETVWFKAPQDLQLFARNGREVGSLMEAVGAYMHSSWMKMMEGIDLANIDEDRDEFFRLVVPHPRVTIDGEDVPLCARYEPGKSGPELHQIEEIEVTGRAVIEVRQVELTHRRLGDVAFAYGESTLGKPALVVVTEDETGGRVSIRLRDPELPSRDE